VISILNIRDFLNQLFWDKNYSERIEDFEIIYIHRGAPGDVLRFNCKNLIHVFPGSFEYYEKEIDEPKIIPFHRITEIIDVKNNTTLFKKPSKKSSAFEEE
jgi:uncharacterized protein (UPF0248 family)